MRTTISKLLLLISMPLWLAGCEIGAFEAPADATLESAAFSGVDSAIFNSDNELVLFWNPIDANLASDASDFSYYIYYQKVTAEEANLLLATSSEQESIGSRTTVVVPVTALGEDKNPSLTGELLDSVESSLNSYKVESTLAPTSGHVFLVTAKTKSGQEIGEPQAFVLSSGPLGAFQGCVSGSAVSGSEIRVTFEYPEATEQVTISRDGSPVYVALTPETVFFDREVRPNRVYTYTCAAKIGDETILGENSLTVQTPDPIAQLNDYDGCISGTAVGPTSIQVNFEFPSVADQVEVYRNGTKVLISKKADAVTSFTDNGLSEGISYSYECRAYIGEDSVVGDDIVTVKTLVTNPPTFAGIVSAADNGSNTALITWGGATGVPVESFKIYSSNSGSLSFSASELVTTQTNSLSKVLTNIGDEIPYIYGVLACSSDTACSGSGATETLTLADTGAPKSSGATAAAIVDSKIDLTVPYEFSDGAVAKRKIYQRTGATGGTNIADYTLVQTDVIAYPYTAITSTVTVNSAISENTTYHYIVRDEDPSGNTETNTNFVTIATTDLTPPTFSGLDSLANGSAGNEDTEITLHFTPIASQPGDSDGASNYVVYTLAGGGDACASGTVAATLDATSYTNGVADTYLITGLSERTNYAVCLKARDSDGNYSTNTVSTTRYTHDITAPSFDGIQSISYNSTSGDLEVRWNASPTSDIKEYTVNVYKNATPYPGTQFVKAHSSFSTGYDMTTAEFAYTSNDVVYVVVNACDDAASLPLSSQNCTTYVDANKKSVTVPDADPPPSFLGIKGSGFVTSPSEGVADVDWFTPADWSDYAGFYVYNYESSTLSLLKDCACVSLDCDTNNLGTCQLTNLDPYRTYNFHVRAYDLAGNITTYLDPDVKSTSLRVKDETAPTFTSNMTASYDSGNGWIDLDWSAATDNQYASEPGATITYNLYRKIGSDYADSSDPSADGTLLNAGTTTTHDDSSGLNSAAVHYYAICAVDSTGNAACDGVSKQVTLPDVVPPSLTNLATDKTTLGKSWGLTWSMSDDSGGNISVNIRYTISDSPETPTEGSSTSLDLIVNQSSYSGLTGPLNANKYVNYLLVAQDPTGNKATATLSVYSTNLVTITSISPNQGKTAGGKLVYIQGSGFVDGDTTLTIGGNTCTASTPYFVDSTKFVCVTTAGSAGAADVVVTNSDGSSDTVSNGYTYGNSSCDNVPGGQAYTYSGSGLSNDPYIICTADQLKDMENVAAANTDYFRLDDNLDLTGYTINIPGAGIFDGNDHILANYTLKDDTRDDVALFINGIYNVNDLGMINVDVEGQNHVGAMFAETTSGTPVLDNLFVTGTVVGRQYVGGLIGGHTSGSSNHTLQNSFSLANVTGYRQVGGLTGVASTIANSYATGSVGNNSAYAAGDYVGGLTGEARGNITNSYATGTVTATDATYVGGLVGIMYSDPYTISGSYATGNVTALSGAGGLIGYARGDTVSNSYSTGDVSVAGNYVGGLMGRARGISCSVCYATGNVTQTSFNSNGGLFGELAAQGATNSTVTASYATGNLTCTVAGCQNNGGFAGLTEGTTSITNSYATGNLTTTGSLTGGFIGTTSGTFAPALTISGCYATGTVNSSSTRAGGFYGQVNSDSVTITESYATGNVTADTQVGGFIGETSLVVVSESYASGNVAATGTNDAGGFVGFIDEGADFQDNYARGTVTGSNRVGGFIGSINSSGGVPTIARNYASGAVSGVTDVGGFLGSNPNTVTCSESLWDTASTGQGSSACGTGKNTSEMQTQSTFDTDNSWDFTAGTGIWEMPGGSAYPIFQWE